MKKATHINRYIAGFPPTSRRMLKSMRAIIRKAIPGAEEKISYNIPAFRLNGWYVVYFAEYKNHISIYPAPRGVEAFKEELSAYKGGKGTVQFPLDKPLPADLITRIVKFRVKLSLQGSKKR